MYLQKKESDKYILFFIPTIIAIYLFFYNYQDYFIYGPLPLYINEIVFIILINLVPILFLFTVYVFSVLYRILKLQREFIDTDNFLLQESENIDLDLS